MNALLEVRGLAKHYPLRRGVLRRTAGAVRALDGISLDIGEGETLGLVGESGCGKSTAARAILQLVTPSAGSVRFLGDELTRLAPRALRRARRHMQMVFQDPYASLPPRLSVGSIVAEPLEIHAIGTRVERAERVRELLALVGLDASATPRYPHEFSGGQRQRIGIARALATSPRLLVADEPVSALDVSIQAQVVNLLGDLKQRLRLTYLLIAHDLAMVRHLSDRVAVMYLGRIVELAAREKLFQRPLHPYTQALLAAIPVPDPDAARARPRLLLKGELESLAHPPSGCRFRNRCPIASERCAREDPELRDLGRPGAPQLVACHHPEPGPRGEP